MKCVFVDALVYGSDVLTSKQETGHHTRMINYYCADDLIPSAVKVVTIGSVHEDVEKLLMN